MGTSIMMLWMELQVMVIGQEETFGNSEAPARAKKAGSIMSACPHDVRSCFCSRNLSLYSRKTKMQQHGSNSESSWHLHGIKRFSSEHDQDYESASFLGTSVSSSRKGSTSRRKTRLCNIKRYMLIPNKTRKNLFGHTQPVVVGYLVSKTGSELVASKSMLLDTSLPCHSRLTVDLPPPSPLRGALLRKASRWFWFTVISA